MEILMCTQTPGQKQAPEPIPVATLLRTPIPILAQIKILSPMLVITPMSVGAQIWMATQTLIPLPPQMQMSMVMLMQIAMWVVTAMLTVTEIPIAIRGFVLFVASRESEDLETLTDEVL